jgi:hypothetical protein
MPDAKTSPRFSTTMLAAHTESSGKKLSRQGRKGTDLVHQVENLVFNRKSLSEARDDGEPNTSPVLSLGEAFLHSALG